MTPRKYKLLLVTGSMCFVAGNDGARSQNSSDKIQKASNIEQTSRNKFSWRYLESPVSDQKHTYEHFVAPIPPMGILPPSAPELPESTPSYLTKEKLPDLPDVIQYQDLPNPSNGSKECSQRNRQTDKNSRDDNEADSGEKVKN
jgi:hypothetical protein